MTRPDQRPDRDPQDQGRPEPGSVERAEAEQAPPEASEQDVAAQVSAAEQPSPAPEPELEPEPERRPAPGHTPSDQPGGGVPVAAPPIGASISAPAELPPASRSGRGMFGVAGSGDTSGFGGLQRRQVVPESSPRPYGEWFDEAYDALAEAYPQLPDAIERVVVDRGELTLHIVPGRIAEVCRVLRDDPGLRFELCSSVSGVDYLDDPAGRRLHAVYQLTSMTYRRVIRLEAAVTAERPHLPSVTSVYPTADWQEREAYDMFGIVFDGHPALTRILMPDDWEGYPQRKDYPLGGVPVEYQGAEIPPPDRRRSYQ